MAVLINNQTQQSCLLQSHHSFGRLNSSVDTFISDAYISKVHAFIEWNHEHWLLRDVSSNGTWLNGNKLARDQVVELNVGDVITFASKSGNAFEVYDINPPCDYLVPIEHNSEAIELEYFHLLPSKKSHQMVLSYNNQTYSWWQEYIDLGEAEATYVEGTNEHIYKGTMKGINLSAVGSVYLLENLALFGKAGVFNWYGENKGPFSTFKADDWAPSVGAGLTYQLTDEWQARFEYQYFHHLGNDTLGGTNAHLTSIGISYQFGRKRSTIVTKTVMKAVPIELEAITFPFLFDFDSSELLLVDSLGVIVKRLTKYPQTTVILRGYSDSTGSEKYNLALSERRTKSIANYLIAQGVKNNQIISEHYGEQYPVSDNDTDEHRHLNRHVQILLPSVFINNAQEQ